MGSSTRSNQFQIQLVGDTRLKADRPGKHQKPRHGEGRDRYRMPLRVHIPIILSLLHCHSHQSNLLTKAETAAGPGKANIYLLRL